MTKTRTLLILSGVWLASCVNVYAKQTSSQLVAFSMLDTQAQMQVEQKMFAESELRTIALTSMQMSKAGLNQQSQIDELTNTILYMYHHENFFDYISSKLSSNTQYEEQELKSCLLKTYHDKNFSKVINQCSQHYVKKHRREKVQKYLQLLINSGYNQEMKTLLEIRNKPAYSVPCCFMLNDPKDDKEKS